MKHAARRIRRILLFCLTVSIPCGSAGIAEADFPGCGAPFGDPEVTLGSVACQLVPSVNVGGPVPVSYYVPSACDPASDGGPCPVLYLLHGFGGSYRSLLGTADDPSAWVKALTSGPPVDPESPTVLDPWTWADTSKWIDLPPIDMILVAPHGRTLPDGFGPEADLDSFWTDWNPRYAAGSEEARYETEPPRFESFLIEELIPYVETHLGGGAGREWRALDGESLGGYGSYKNGLQHPDVWASVGSISGAHNFLFAPWLDPTPVTSPVGITSPVDLGYTPLPGATSALPFSEIPDEAKGFAVALVALGDPVADHAFYRGNMPRDLAMNGRAFREDVQVLHLRAMVNDTIPRRAEDVTSFSPASILFEDIVLPMNLEMQLAFAVEGVHDDFRLHPGLHSRPYRDPYLRRQIEKHHDRLEHRDGGGTPIGAPDVFDYRSIRDDFTIWGWHFQVERGPVEFLNLRQVSCSGLTLQGTGRVTVSVPLECGTEFENKNPFTVELGQPHPIDEPAGASALPVYGTTAIIELDPS